MAAAFTDVSPQRADHWDTVPVIQQHFTVKIDVDVTEYSDTAITTALPIQSFLHSSTHWSIIHLVQGYVFVLPYPTMSPTFDPLVNFVL